MYGTYLRLNVHVYASNMEVLRAARKKLAKKFRCDRSVRDERHKFYRKMLEYHRELQQIALDWNL